MSQDYPQYNEDIRKSMKKLSEEIPGTMKAFMDLHKQASADGALDAKTKELIALAIAITVRCNGCIAFHVHDAIESGASRKEIMETIAVAVLMGGGPSVVYGSEAMDALNQFKETDAA